jgi:hypothetical protein
MVYGPLDGDPAPDSVRRLTFVAFLPGGDCIAIPDQQGGLTLPTGEVRPGEDYLLDTCLRVPLETAGYHRQRIGPFAADGDHVYVWLDGDRYAGRHPHADVALIVASPDELASRLITAGQPDQARAVLDGARAFRDEDDDRFYAGAVRLMEPAYLSGTTPQTGSGFGGDAQQWRARREHIVDGIDRDGSFLDVGCANGLLMESVREWAAERGHRIEPYGVDLAPRLVELARRRLPYWADRIEVGNAIDYRPAGDRRFTFVHLLLDTVPMARRSDLVQHALYALVEPGGRVLVSHYKSAAGADLSAAGHLARLGFAVGGESSTSDGAATLAWIDVSPLP